MSETEKRQAEQIEEYQKELEEMGERLGEAEERAEVARSQLTTIAMQEFQKEKTALVEMVRKDLGDEKATEVDQMIGTDPRNLESTKMFVKLLQDALAIGRGDYAPAPKGQVPLGGAPLQRSPSSDEEGVLREIDRVYTELKMQYRLQRQGRHNPEKLAELERQRKMLMASFLEGIKGKRARKEAIVAEFPSIMNCPQCKFPLVGETTCRKCGYHLSEADRKEFAKY